MSQDGDTATPATATDEVAVLREKLQLMQQIQALQLQLNPHAGTSRRQPTMATVKVPEGSHNMSPTEFRTYKKDCSNYQTLTGAEDNQVVLQLRLNMDSELKRILDTNHPNWDTLTVDEAVEIVGHIVNEASNPVVYRKQFDHIFQKKDETIQEFVTNLRICAMDCAFVCPFNDQHDLTDYHIINRIRTGLYDDTLQQEILQKYERLNSVDALMQYCSNFESTKRDKDRLHTSPTSVGATIRVDSDLSEEEIVAAISSYKKQKQFHKGNTSTRGMYKTPFKNRPKTPSQTCPNCGYVHGQKCPATDKYCMRCSMKGHFSRVCPQGTTGASAVFISTILSSCSQTGTIQSISLLVGDGFVPLPRNLDVIPDTGAEVTVAGDVFLKQLGIKESKLNTNHQKLRHVAGGNVEVIGSCFLSFHSNDYTCVEQVYFIAGISKIFLSITACRELKLIPQGFPFITVPDDIVAAVNTQGEEAEGCRKYSEINDEPSVMQELGNNNSGVSVIVPECPEVMPYEAIEDNIGNIEDWFLKTFSETVFNIERSPLPPMSGKPQHIHLQENAVPYAVHTPIPLPHHWRDEVKEKLQGDVNRCILEKVPVGEPVDWCTRLVTVKKKDGSPRLTVDFQKLNSHCKRETHPNTYPFDLVSSIPLYTYKTVADAYNGYHQILLDAESSKLTTFITEYGRFRYLHTPQGLCSAGDAYNRRFDEILSDIPRKQRVVDDTILYDSSIEQSFYHTFDFLSTCARNKVTLNPNKFKFAKKEVDFLGYKLGWDRYSPSMDTLSSIHDFPMPNEPSISDIRAWFGLVNQIAPFFAMSSVMEPFRDLLKPSNAKGKSVYWDNELQISFNKSKEFICNEASKGLAYFDTNKNTLAITDWSKEGIAFTIFQQHCSCTQDNDPFCCKGGWQLVLCGSRFLQEAERNYAPIEGEALAITWCLKKAKNFLLGCPSFTLLTDHKPLVSIFADKELSSIANPRLFRLKQKTLQYSFKIKHIQGKDMYATDTLSRYPVQLPDEDDRIISNDLNIAAISVATACAYEILTTMSDFEEIASKDEQYQTLLKTIKEKAFAKCKREENDLLKDFFHVKNRLSICDNLIMYSFDDGDLRLVIPKTLQPKVIKNLHSAHQCPDTILLRARQSVYWPGLQKDIEQLCQSCKSCSEIAPSQTSLPLSPSPIPQYPFQHVVADLFQKDGREYIAYADRLTGWVELAYFKTTTKSSDVINVVRNIFHHFGVPEQISLDGGPNLTSKEFSNFLTIWGVKRRLSSSYYPKSNGRAEAAVKTMKRLIMENTGKGGNIDSDEIAVALLQYRNTPLKGANKSPAQLLLGRKLRDSIPQSPKGYEISDQWQYFIRQREVSMGEKNVSSKAYHDQKTKMYATLSSGTMVRCQNTRTKKWDRNGLIVEVLPHRQYNVRMDGSGRVSLRNRIHLRPMLHIPPHLPMHAESRTSIHETGETVVIPSSETNVHTPTIDTSSSSMPLVRRSTRNRRSPERFGEWVK